MIAKGIVCCALVVVCVACKSPSVVTQGNANQHITALHTHDTVVVRDSVFVSEKMRGDTIFLTRTQWRDRWRTRIVHDTVIKTDSIVRVIEHPPRKYVPGFYKWCTGLLWVIVVLVAGLLGYKAMRR